MTRRPTFEGRQLPVRAFLWGSAPVARDRYDDGGTRQRAFGTFRTESVVPRKNAATEPRIISSGPVQDPDSPWT